MNVTTTTRQEAARQRFQVIATALEVADEELVKAFRERDWETLGYDSWESYCAELPGMEMLKLRAPARKARAKALRAEGATIPQIVAATHSSLGTIHRDLTGPKPVAAPEEMTWRRAVEYVAAAGAAGLTVHELVRKSGCHHGQASGALSKAARQKQAIVPTAVFRERCAVYVRP